MVVQTSKYFLFLSCFLITGMSGQGNIDSVRLDCTSDNYKKEIEDFLPNQFFVQKIIYDVDFLYDQQDFLYMTGISDNSEISREQLVSACFYLKQLDRFKHIDLVITKTNQGYNLRFQLIGHRIFSKLVLSGSVRDKDFYKNMYLIDVADVFDIQKHQHSLSLMKQYFYDKGYCNAQIFDMLKDDPEHKTVSVKLELNKGPKFLIGEVDFEVQAVGAIAQADVLRMKKKIEDVCFKRLELKIYSQDLVKKIKGKIKYLLERYGFMNFDLVFNKKIDDRKHRVDIKISITLEQKKEFVFFGNHFFKRQEILDHLLMYGKSSWHFPSSIIVDELMQLYKSKGFWNVSISVREEKNRVFCLINEGARVSVSSVLFKNNERFSDRELERQAFKQFVHAKYFDKNMLKRAIDGLLRFYRQHGFWDVKVIKEEFLVESEKYESKLLVHNRFPIKNDCFVENIECQKQKKVKKIKSSKFLSVPDSVFKSNSNVDLIRDQPTSYKLILAIEEGRQRKIGTYSVVGFPELEKQGPFLRASQEIGTDFDQTILIEQKQWLLRHFRNLGYSKAGVDCELQESGDQLNVLWKIVLHGQAIKFGKVLVVGNSIIPAAKIMREVVFKQADPWDKSKIEETLKRLKELEIFDLVQVYPSRDMDDNLEKPIFVKIIDASPYELRTRMGFQQVGKDFRLGRGYTYKIGGTFLIRNPFNIADRFIFEGDFTRYYRNAAVSYQFPWLFTKLIRCQYKLYDNIYDQPVYIGSKVSLYQAGQRGFLFNMTHSFTKTIVSGNVGVEFMGIKEANEPDLQSIIDYDKNLLGKKIGYLFFEPNFMWQQVDSITNPKNGHLSFASCKGMLDLNTKTSFFKLLVEHSFYLPLRDPLILAVRMRGGHVFNRKYSQIIPIERFYLGGASSLRGYARDYCPPLGLLTEPVKDEYNQLPPEAGTLWRFAPQGGRTMLNLNTEFRFKLYRGLGAVIFNDVGALFKDSISTALKDKSDHFLGGSGFGFRYDTPIGPLRFDVAFKWNRIYRDFEPRCLWYLTLGHAF